MARSILRFDPPPVEMTAELVWMLSRTFGPVEAPAPPSLDGSEAFRLVRLFGTAARIAARHSEALLSRELGPENTVELRASRLRAVASQLRCEAAMEQVAELARGASIPLVYLKFAALSLAVELTEGSRDVGDLDVLVEGGQGQELHELLLGNGWRVTDLPPPEQHLESIGHPLYGLVEVHRVIPGVQVGLSGVSATLGALEEGGLIEALEDRPGCWVPARACLVAHAMTHGLVQHGDAPASYPALRVFADLIDLGLGGEEGEALASEAAPLISRVLPEEEVMAVVELCRSLAEGGAQRLFDDSIAHTREGLFLRHALAGMLSPEYRSALKLKNRLVRPLTDRPTLIAVGHSLLSAVFITRGQIDVIYGRPRTELGYFVRRLLRPFDLVWRTFKYSVSLARDRARRSLNG